MAQETQPRYRRGGLHFLRGTAVGLAGFGVAARMVVGESEGATIVAKNRVQDLPYGHQRAVD